MVILPYVKGMTEPIQQILKHQEIATSVRHHQNIRRILVHPKDKVEDCKKTDCDHTYIGETGRTFGTRLEEHKKEIENIKTRRFTREHKKVSTVIEHKSAITDHAERNNCIRDWEGAKVIGREWNRNARWIREAIWIRKTTPVMNRDEGGIDWVKYGTACLPRQLASRGRTCRPRIPDEGCQKLNCYGIREHILTRLMIYLEHRTQYVTHNNVNLNHKTVMSGVPQCCILGPLLFILYINDLCNPSTIMNLTFLQMIPVCIIHIKI